MRQTMRRSTSSSGAIAVLALAALASTASTSTPAAAWGPTGHRVVGLVAEEHLEPRAAEAVAEVLGGPSLAQVGTWADDIRSDKAWDFASSWHYVNYEGDETYAESEKSPKGDVITAILCLSATLADRDAPVAARRDALRWLVHLVGDIHQPLHSGFAHDRGGNNVKVWWFGESSNLHRVWDGGIVDSEKLSFTELASFLPEPTPEEVRTWQASGPAEWSAESRALLPEVYEIGDHDLGYLYRYRHVATIHERLRRAGVRLAGVLNHALDGPPPPPAADEERCRVYTVGQVGQD